MAFWSNPLSLSMTLWSNPLPLAINVQTVCMRPFWIIKESGTSFGSTYKLYIMSSSNCRMPEQLYPPRSSSLLLLMLPLLDTSAPLMVTSLTRTKSRNSWLAQVPEPCSSMWIPRCVWCSINFYPGLCIHCPSTGQLDLERSSVRIGRAPAVVNAVSEGHNMSVPCTLSPGLWIWMWGHPSSQHIHYHSQIHFVVGGGWWKEVPKSVWLDQPYWSQESLFPS